MIDLYRQPSYPALSASHRRWPAVQPDRVYGLIAVLLPDGDGRQRPILGLRRHLSLLRAELAGEQHKLVRPLVLRTTLGECIQTQVTNLLGQIPLTLALVDDDYAILETGSAVAQANGETHTYTFHCCHAGVYPIYNRACSDPVERRSLLGVLIIEP